MITAVTTGRCSGRREASRSGMTVPISQWGAIAGAAISGLVARDSVTYRQSSALQLDSGGLARAIVFDLTGGPYGNAARFHTRSLDAFIELEAVDRLFRPGWLRRHSARVAGRLRHRRNGPREPRVALKNPANLKKWVSLTTDEFRYGFGNMLSHEDSEELFRRWTIPSPGRPLFQAAFANFNPNAATKV